MNDFLYYIRDHLVGTHYFIYAFILLFLMFSIIGYLFKQKYGKYDIKLKTSQEDNKKVEEKTKQKVEPTKVKSPEPIIEKSNVKITQEPVKVSTNNVSQAANVNQSATKVEPVKTQSVVSTQNTIPEKKIDPVPMPAPSKETIPTPMPAAPEVKNPTPISPLPTTQPVKIESKVENNNQPIPEL